MFWRCPFHANFHTVRWLYDLLGSYGIFLSKSSYLIALWGGCGIVLRKSLQVIQNKVARVVTKLDWSTSPQVLLTQVGWLSVKQLVFYHSVLLIYKVRMSQVPKYLNNMFSWSYQYNTRQAEGGLIKLPGKPKLVVSKRHGFFAQNLSENGQICWKYFFWYLPKFYKI